jgi:hypothetical protein
MIKAWKQANFGEQKHGSLERQTFLEFLFTLKYFTHARHSRI